MIGSFRDGETGALAFFYQDNVRNRDIPGSIEKQLRRKLSLIEAAATEKSLIAAHNNNYERLDGNLQGWSSIRVSIQWRLIFRRYDGNAYDLYLDSNTY